MGGMIAQHLALEHRERVRSLGADLHDAGRAAAAARRGGCSSAPRCGRSSTPEHIFRLSAPMLYAKHTRDERPEELADDLKVRLSDPTPAKTSWAQLAAIRVHDTRHRLSELADLPVTVIHGDEDVLVPTDRGRDLAEQIPGSRLDARPRRGPPADDRQRAGRRPTRCSATSRGRREVSARRAA